MSLITSANNNLVLNCLIYGDPLDEAFDVVIHREQPVSHLKRLIKDQNQHTFAHLDAKRLSLWGVSIPVWNKREFENLVLENSKKLQPLRKIGDMFKDELFEDCIDIIVRIPEA